MQYCILRTRETSVDEVEEKDEAGERANNNVSRRLQRREFQSCGSKIWPFRKGYKGVVQETVEER